MKKDIIITIFGSTGDLTARKLLPAIAKLYKDELVSKNIEIIALGRKSYDTAEYLNAVLEIDKNLDIHTLEKIVKYYQMQITDLNDYDLLNKYIKDSSNEHTKHVYYLAIGPDLLPVVIKNIHDAKLVLKSDNKQVLIFEKPFGHDLSSAKTINNQLHEYFNESQIYRIDHYLAKEMIQNIMPIRFKNPIFSNIWNNNFIESVKIVATEKDGILNRGQYYETSGALKDMVQSHLLQILALIAMEKPISYSSDSIKEEKLKVLKNLIFDEKSLIFGQYDGYLNELHIKKDSTTETFVELKVFVDNPLFKNVPFIISTGKALDKKETYIEITLKSENNEQNIIKISTTPKDSLSLFIKSKKAGFINELETQEVRFDMYNDATLIPEAYGKMILDAIMEDQTLYISGEEIEVCWDFVDKVTKHKKDLVIYNSKLDLIKK